MSLSLILTAMAARATTPAPSARRAQIEALVDGLPRAAGDDDVAARAELRDMLNQLADQQTPLAARYALRPFKKNATREVARLAKDFAVALNEAVDAPRSEWAGLRMRALNTLIELHLITATNAGEPPDLFPEARVISVPAATASAWGIVTASTEPGRIFATLGAVLYLGFEMVRHSGVKIQNMKGARWGPASVGERLLARFWERVNEELNERASAELASAAGPAELLAYSTRRLGVDREAAAALCGLRLSMRAAQRDLAGR